MRLPSTTPRTRKRIHLTLALLWALCLVPTLLWWKDSILWVATMSLYANFVGHLSAAEAADEGSSS